MTKNDCLERENEIYRQYQEIISCFISELEVRDNEYPTEIFNEIRSIFTHLSRYKLQNKKKDLESAERHVQRAILDCYKYLCISIAEKLKNFRKEFQNVDLSTADNGKFLPELNKLESCAKTLYLEAKKNEIKKEISDDDLYFKYEQAYNAYSNLDKFLNDSQESILYASTKSKKTKAITIISFAIGLVGLIFGLPGFIGFIKNVF